MIKFTVHGSFENPKTAKQYARFSSPDFLTVEEAERELELWKSTRTYTYQWIEKRDK